MPLSKVQFSESLGRRRLNINGGMIVAQRGTSAQSATSGAYQSVDKSYTSSTTSLILASDLSILFITSIIGNDFSKAFFKTNRV